MQGFFLSLLLWGTLWASSFVDESFLNTLYRSLHPESIAELFAFYSLYPQTTQGKQALIDGWRLLYKHQDQIPDFDETIVLPDMEIDGLIALVNQRPFETMTPLSERELEKMEEISKHLSNRKLKGHGVWKKEELDQLKPEEIDLGRALLLLEFESDPLKIRHYEAVLDLIALQILAHLPKGANDLEKIDAINQFIFYEKGFRFPPHSLSIKEIDTYTFLPLVLDSRLGVCLGVSILYLCIAERIDLPLEIVTPPGHIFLRYRRGKTTLNIETTARGIDLPDETYLGINTAALPQRNKKEVIGLSLMNQASVFLQKEAHQTTLDLYKKAQVFLPDDPVLKMLLAYQYLFIGKTKKGKALLKEIKDVPSDSPISRETTPEDYLHRKVNVKGIRAIFLQVDESRASIIHKQQALQTVLKQCPHFREGLLHYAITYLQMERTKEALDALNAYHAIDPTSPLVEYYLAILSMQRFLYAEAWEHLALAETLTSRQGYHPNCLKALRQTLKTLYLDPQDRP